MSIRIDDLATLDFSDVATDEKLPPIHPGEIPLEEFLKPMGLTQYRLAKEIGVPQRRISKIVAGKRAITADTGFRLSRFCGMNNGFWVGLQADYDVGIARNKLTETLATIQPWRENFQAF